MADDWLEGIENDPHEQGAFLFDDFEDQGDSLDVQPPSSFEDDFGAEPFSEEVSVEDRLRGVLEEFRGEGEGNSPTPKGEVEESQYPPSLPRQAPGEEAAAIEPPLAGVSEEEDFPGLELFHPSAKEVQPPDTPFMPSGEEVYSQDRPFSETDLYEDAEDYESSIASQESRFTQAHEHAQDQIAALMERMTEAMESVGDQISGVGDRVRDIEDARFKR